MRIVGTVVPTSPRTAQRVKLLLQRRPAGRRAMLRAFDDGKAVHRGNIEKEHG
jgi:hypothetical protein